MEGLDRMRVTMKVRVKDTATPPIRHNLDLYNDTQVEKFIRRAAEKLEVGTTVLTSAIATLTDQLEAWRLEEIKKQCPRPYEPPMLQAGERKAALELLQSENLLERTNELIGASGIIGEKINRLIMYLIFTSRKRPQPLHVISLGSSGTGKTHLQEKVGELIPWEEKIEITTLSENAFYYFGQRELKNRLILIEDLDGAENVLYPLRELQSKKKISKTIAHKNSKGETRTIHLVVEGPVCVAGCTTKEGIYEDNANRSFLLYLDEGEAQDARIMDYQRRLSAGNIDEDAEEEARKLLRNCQRILEPVRVINPYAELLKIPEEVFKPRRTNAHYLAFIEVVTYYHQYQREQRVDKETGEVFIETTIEDIENANRLLKEVLLRKSDELSGACRNYFERLKKYMAKRITEDSSQSDKEEDTAENVGFTNRRMSQYFRIPLTTIKRYHLDLYNSGRLRIVKKGKGRTYYYEIVSYEEYTEMESKIVTVLDDVLESIKQSKKRSNKRKKSGSPVAQ